MKRCSITLVLSALSLVACGDDDAPSGDAMVDADVDAGADAGDGPLAPAPPMEAALPTLTPCEDGWREVAHADGYTACEPWPESGRANCGGASAHFPGTPGCVTIGTACPADGMPEGLPGGVTVHWVRAGASGAGTRADPYGTVGEGVAAASAGDIVAIGTGSYDESVGIPRGVTLWGACASETVLLRSAPGGTAVVYATAVDTTLRNVTIGGSSRPGIEIAGSGRSLEVQDVVVDGAEHIGVNILGGALTARRLVVRDTRLRDTASRGILIAGGGRFDGAEIEVVRAPLVALLASGPGTTVTVSGVALIGAIDGALSGLGAFANAGASLSLTSAAIEDNEGAGGFSTGAGTTVSIVDSVIRDNRPVESGEFGRAFNFEAEAVGEIRRSLLSGHRDVGLYVDGGELTIEDSVVREVDSEERDQRGGIGLEIREPGSLVARRVVVADSHSVGILGASRATLTLEDTRVLRTRGQRRDESLGLGVQLEIDTMAEMDRIILTDNRRVGLGSFQGHAAVRDLIIRDTDSDASLSRLGRGISIEGGTFTLARALLSNNRDIGLFVAEATADVDDLQVIGMRPNEDAGDTGRAINYQFGATGTLRRVLVEDAYEVGIAAVAECGPVTFEGLVVRGIREQQCATTTCAAAPFGVGIVIDRASIATVTDFVIEDIDLCGVLLAFDGSLDLRDGTVRRSDIGACVQVEGYDFARLTEDVVYEDNGTNLDATALPVPPVPDAVL